MTRSCVLLPGILLCAAAAHATAPEVQFLFPAGGQRGQTVAVTVAGTLGDAPLTAWCDRDDVTVEPGEQAGTLRVTVSPDAPPGLCWIRLSNADGASALRPFVVGTLPEVLEQEPNDAADAAQQVFGSEGEDETDIDASVPPQAPRGVVVNGRLEKNGDVDVFAVPLKAGETLVAAMTANEVLGSPMDGVLQILSPQGFVLDQNDDDQGFDPRLVFTAEDDGTYFVRSFAFPAQPNSSITFSGAANYVYRLTLTTGPFVDHAFPLAVERGSPARLRVKGWNIADDLRELDATFLSDGSRAVVWHPQLAGTAEAVIVPHAAAIEQQPNGPDTPQPVELPVTVSGCIDEPGDADVYSFQASKGQKLVIQAESRALGAPLDPVLRLTDADGQTLREVDDSTRGVFDPRLEFTVTADGEHRIRITDLHRGGGFRYVYRMTIGLERPEYALSLAGDRFTLMPGTPLEIPVTVERRHGFGEEIEIAAVGLPDGISAAPVRSVPGDDSGKAVTLRIEAEPGTVWSGPLRIVGGTTGDTEQPQPATAAVPGLPVRSADLWLTIRPEE